MGCPKEIKRLLEVFHIVRLPITLYCRCMSGPLFNRLIILKKTAGLVTIAHLSQLEPGRRGLQSHNTSVASIGRHFPALIKKGAPVQRQDSRCSRTAADGARMGRATG